MNILFTTPLLLVVAYLTLSSLYQLTLSIAAQFKTKRSLDTYRTFKKFLVLIPAYQEDEVILNSVKKNKALSFQYPRTKFDLVVIADGLQRNTIYELRKMGAQVVKVDFDQSTKVKALQAAMNNYDHGYDGVVVLDSDNLMNWDFLHRMNIYLHNGYKVIQAQRAPFNKENAIATLDGMAEIANHKIFCKGANRMGLSSKLSGSGMVFDFQLFKKVIHKLKAVGGFDKELELLFTKRRQHIAYVEEAIVYDQKVSNTSAYELQRGRWLEAQYSFFGKHWLKGLKGLSLGNFDYFHKTYQLAMPPRFLVPFALFMLLIVGVLFQISWIWAPAVLGLVSNLASYLLVLPLELISQNFKQIISVMPKLFSSTIKALRLMKRSRMEFLHTPHQQLAQS